MNLHDIWTFASHQLSTNQFFSATVMGGGLLGVVAYFRNLPRTIYYEILDRITVTMEFNSTDRMYFYLQKWLNEHTKYDRFKKTYTVISQPFSYTPSYADEDDKVAPHFIWTPAKGTFYLRYNGKFMKIRCEKNSPEKQPGSSAIQIFENMSIAYLGRSTAYGKQMLEDIRKVYEETVSKDLYVFIPGRTGNHWQQHSKVLPRKIESIICKDKMLDGLLADFGNFLKPETETWYIDRGIPYHRGYLFQGPPGTGKTTTAYTLASHFKMNVYYANISSNISDEDFFGLMASMDERGIVVLEDIDCIFDENRKKSADLKLSFSAMLNAIDGVCAKHGSIVIMTTNHPEKLDPALTRKGRVDLKLTFDLCDTSQLERLFLKFYDSEIDAKTFARLIPAGLMAPVDVQDYLMGRATSREALADIDTFIANKKGNHERKESKTTSQDGEEFGRGQEAAIQGLSRPEAIQADVESEDGADGGSRIHTASA